ncbi:MAG TPA: MFS transporter, partial [Halieaceae bacterium]|nr:MFS transporter [Halieaceae bacterium]
GGLLTLFMGLLTWALLPESPEFLAGRAGSWPDRATEVNKLLGRMRRAAISDIA